MCAKPMQKKVVSEVSFTFKKGQVLGILGPNGAGKTKSRSTHHNVSFRKSIQKIGKNIIRRHETAC
jgi:ABC-type lipopolysaccharide export system ATPase subunit